MISDHGFLWVQNGYKWSDDPRLVAVSTLTGAVLCEATDYTMYPRVPVDGIPWEIHAIEDPTARALAREEFLRNEAALNVRNCAAS